jgi:hypothetical protein
MLLFLHLLASVQLMHCTMLISSHLYSYTLDHVEPELEELTEQAPVEVINTELSQGKPRCIPPIILDFFITIFMLRLIMH